jgi:acetyl-CoA carboxylase biotin carboxylase subunit
MDIETVLAVSEADRFSLPAQMADRSVCIGPPLSSESYLKVDTIIAAAIGTGADAIHPGYGFLAEKPELAKACAKYGLIFIGPKAEHIKQMGDKIFARQVAVDTGISIIPGSQLIGDFRQATEFADQTGYPVLLKAAAGGGGKGMKIVKKPADLRIAFNEASAEARSAFGDERLYLEHYIENARHVEIQLFGDGHGNVVHLFERDCSLQRRYQKLVEEAPSEALDSGLREKVCRAAVKIAAQIEYLNAGTVEFIFDRDQEQFYFLEMNTRIQVEHPVTEQITGIDLVKEQFGVAVGNPLSFEQKDVNFVGHAIECRINAESPENNFLPSPGKIVEWIAPEGDNIRLDSHCFPGYLVPPFYDSLLGKIIVKGSSRSEAIEEMSAALRRFQISGIHTNIPFHRQILDHPDYQKGEINTRWIENRLAKEHNFHEEN